jgi:hypothetical protein
MCSGNITRYTCGHESRTYYYKCPDEANKHIQELLPHRLIGRRFRARRLCRNCENQRLQEESIENNDRQIHDERAKALVEFFRGERRWPRPDDEVREIFAHAYAAGDRLHPWLYRGNEPALEHHRAMIEEDLGFEGANMFRIMLDRQANIDRTGRPITADDRQYALGSLLERRRQVAVEVQLIQHGGPDELRDREQNPREQIFRRVAREVEQANTEILQEVARLSEQISVLQEAVDQRRAVALQQASQDEVSEGDQDLRQEYTDREWAEYERVRENARETTQEMSLLMQHAESFWIQEVVRQRQRLLDQFSEAINEELERRTEDMDEARELQPVIQQQEAPQAEQQNGLYESDPDWLLNFDDWCTENSTVEAPYTEIDLRRDINGWFQHLRTCESQVRLDWIPFAETYRDAILAGESCYYEYVPVPNVFNFEPLSFRHWIIANADPAEIRVSSMTYMFISFLEGYADYLRNNECLGDLAAFLHERSVRVKIMRGCLALIPGAPISQNLNDTEMMEQSPSNLQMLFDIGRLCREGGHTAEADILQRDAQVARFHLLRIEANYVREGRLAGYRIEREERETRTRAEREERTREEIEEDVETESDDDGLFMVPLTRQTLNIRGRVAGEAMAEQRAEDRAVREAEVTEEIHGEPRREAPAGEVTRLVRFMELPRQIRRRPRPLRATPG